MRENAEPDTPDCQVTLVEQDCKRIDDDRDRVPSRNDKTDYNVWSTLLLATMKLHMATVIPVSVVKEYILGYVSKTASAYETYSYPLQQGYHTDRRPPRLQEK